MHHQLVAAERLAPIFSQSSMPRPLVDLGPEVVLELAPGRRRRRDLPVGALGVAGEREPEDRPGVLGGLAEPVRAADRDAPCVHERGQVVELVLRRAAVALPLDAVGDEAGRVVAVGEDAR
jgi:hypothetical protein